MFNVPTGPKFEISFLFSFHLCKGKIWATLALSEKILSRVQNFVVLVRGLERGVASSFTNLGGIDSIPTAFLVI